MTFVVLNKRLDDQSSVYESNHTIFLPPKHTASQPTEIFPFGYLLSVHFVSYLFFRYCGAASLWRCINHCSSAIPLDPPQWSLSRWGFHHFSSFGSFSWSTIFCLPLLREGDRRIAVVVSADGVLPWCFGSQWYGEGRCGVGQQGEVKVEPGFSQISRLVSERAWQDSSCTWQVLFSILYCQIRKIDLEECV